jgi:uncharacterized protein YfaT (DUF1175 family)
VDLRAEGRYTFSLRIAFALGLILVGSRPIHLDSPTDRNAFRLWFTMLAEYRYYATEPVSEITDCAALVRWAFRESLVKHDTAWARAIKLPVLPAMPSVQQLPRDPRLFRTGASEFAQFADADTLRRFNSYFISRDLTAAKPGDLLFYRQFDRKMPAHVMIWIGASQLEKSPDRWIVYHTGPSGEVRKVRVQDLLAHPSPEWRPIAGNANFLGVYRLNLLRDSE